MTFGCHRMMRKRRRQKKHENDSHPKVQSEPKSFMIFFWFKMLGGKKWWMSLSLRTVSDLKAQISHPHTNTLNVIYIIGRKPHHSFSRITESIKTFHPFFLVHIFVRVFSHFRCKKTDQNLRFCMVSNRRPNPRNHPSDGPSGPVVTQNLDVPLDGN